MIPCTRQVSSFGDTFLRKRNPLLTDDARCKIHSLQLIRGRTELQPKSLWIWGSRGGRGLRDRRDRGLLGNNFSHHCTIIFAYCFFSFFFCAVTCGSYFFFLFFPHLKMPYQSVLKHGLHESTMLRIMIMLIIHLNLSHHQIDQMGSYILGRGLWWGRYWGVAYIIVPPLTAAFFLFHNLSLPLRDFLCKTYVFIDSRV